MRVMPMSPMVCRLMGPSLTAGSGKILAMRIMRRSAGTNLLMGSFMVWSQVPGLKPWVIIRATFVRRGAPCVCKWTEVHGRTEVRGLVGLGPAQVPGLRSCSGPRTDVLGYYWDKFCKARCALCL